MIHYDIPPMYSQEEYSSETKGDWTDFIFWSVFYGLLFVSWLIWG